MKAWITDDGLSIIAMFDLFDDTTVWMHQWALTKHRDKELDGNCTRMLRAIMKNPGVNSLQNHGCMATNLLSLKRSKGNKLISDVLIWTPTRGLDRVGQPATAYLYQLCPDVECNLKNLLGAIDDRYGWGEAKLGKSARSASVNDDNSSSLNGTVSMDSLDTHSLSFFSHSLSFSLSLSLSLSPSILIGFGRFLT